MLFALILFVAAWGWASLPVVPPVALGPNWVSVGLPATPLTIVAHGSQLWVAGNDEMVADSSDGGTHWTVRNLRHHGELLQNFVFFDDQHIAVFGSSGVWYESRDAGVTWSREDFEPQTGFWEVTFPDAQHGYAISRSEIATTSDGGHEWKTGELGDGHGGHLTPVHIAAADAQHAVVLLDSSGKAPQAMLFTADGGKQWRRLALAAGVDWKQIRTRDGKFSFVGQRPAPASGQVGKTVSASASATGLGPLAPAVVPDDAACAPPGCLEHHDHAWRDLRGPVAQEWELPDDPIEPLTGAWAALGDVFCRVSSTLRCRQGQTPWVPGPNDDVDAVPASPQATHTPNPAAPGGPRSNGDVDLRASVGADGRVHQAIVLKASRADMATESLRAVRDWRFRPARQAGKPIPFVADIETSFRMYR